MANALVRRVPAERRVRNAPDGSRTDGKDEAAEDNDGRLPSGAHNDDDAVPASIAPRRRGAAAARIVVVLAVVGIVLSTAFFFPLSGGLLVSFGGGWEGNADGRGGYGHYGVASRRSTDLPNVHAVILTLRNNDNSRKRVDRLTRSIAEMNRHVRNANVTYAVVTVDRRANQTNFGLRMDNLRAIDAMESYRRRNPLSYVAFLEDDTELHPRFLEELERSMRELPPNWTVLHLCIGFVWGRYRSKFQQVDGESKWAMRARPRPPPPRFQPEGPAAPSNRTRVFTVWPNPKAYAGSPVAFVVRPGLVNEDWDSLRDVLSVKNDRPNDIALADAARGRYRNEHFAARDPPLCRENDLGKTWREE